ncbi:alpha/beta hydrolase [Rubrobacter aplysinae]|uniref:alpha/beta hydrolase n=1 Tax=Rubrobacter aplysinae TaxID=909625 RepID=UPI00064C246C|nr:alpha/beta fold hydrolase [Rubrobacter aplysinae]
MVDKQSHGRAELPWHQRGRCSRIEDLATAVRSNNRRGRRWAFGVLALVIVLAAGYLGVSLFVAARLTAPEPSEPERTPESVGLTAREISFEAADGTDLEGWWTGGDSGGPERAVILVHGWGGDRSDEHVLRTAEIYREAGYAVLMPDLRGHGGSERVRRTLGDREKDDVRAALSWVRERGFAPEATVLHGFSMGAATVVGAAPGTGVAAVVEEAGYADLPLLLREEIPERSGLPGFFTPGVLLSADLFLGLDASEVRPVEEAFVLREREVPLFVIHSTADETVPYEHARLFREAYPGSELWRLTGYEHVQAYTHPRYEDRLLGFLRSAGALR